MTAGALLAAGPKAASANQDTEQAAAQALAARFPARPVAECWTATGQYRDQVMQLVDTASAGLPESRIKANRRRGLPVLLDWLDGQARPDLAAAVAGQRGRRGR